MKKDKPVPHSKAHEHKVANPPDVHSVAYKKRMGLPFADPGQRPAPRRRGRA